MLQDREVLYVSARLQHTEGFCSYRKQHEKMELKGRRE